MRGLFRLSFRYFFTLFIISIFLSSSVFAADACNTPKTRVETVHVGDTVRTGITATPDYIAVKVHSKTSHNPLKVKGHVIKKGFDRYMVSYKSGVMPWQASYIDYVKPNETKIKFTQDGDTKRLKNFSANRTPVVVNPTSDQTRVAPDELVVFVERMWAGKHKKALRKMVKHEQWSEWVGHTYWIKNFLAFRIDELVNGEYQVTLKPSFGEVTVHRSVLRPLHIDPWHMQGLHRNLVNTLTRWDNSLAQAEGPSKPILPYRLLMHPNFLLRNARQGADAVFFHLFTPHVMLFDLARGMNPHDVFVTRNVLGNYSWQRMSIFGFWVVYFLMESLFYSPISAMYSSELPPDEALWRFNFEDIKMTDWYATKAQWGFKDAGITVIWIGMSSNNTFDNIGRNISYFTRNVRFMFRNTVNVLFGSVDEDDLEDYDVIEIKNFDESYDRVIGHAYVDKESKEVRYDFKKGPNTRYRIGDKANVFKALFPIIQKVGCEDQEDPCGVQNMITVSHGLSGYLQNILTIRDVAEEFNIQYTCLTGDHCRGMEGMTQSLSTDPDTIAEVMMDGPQFAFLACSVASNDYGKQSIDTFAEFFRLEERKGRVITSTKIVHPVFENLPLEEQSYLSRNQWEWHDLIRSSFTYGPKVSYRLLDRWFSGEDMIPGSSIPSIYDLDYRE